VLSSRKPETRGEDTIRAIPYYVNAILLFSTNTVEKLRNYERFAQRDDSPVFLVIDKPVAKFVPYVHNIRTICTQDLYECKDANAAGTENSK
jgi:hypothetical protein